MLEVWFWQRIVSPHMVGLAAALAELNVKVNYIAEERMSAGRKQQGWLEPEPGDVRIAIAKDKQSVCQLVADAPERSIHICQGIRANGLVGAAQQALEIRGLTQWIIMETVRDVGWRGVIKRFEYSRLFRTKKNSITGVLAAGYLTPDWVVERGVAASTVFPFAYFLDKSDPIDVVDKLAGSVRFIFVGQFIPLKRLDWLIKALGEINNQNFELVVIGSGPLEQPLRQQAENILGDKVNWVGRLPSNEVRDYMATADCLVLPSLYDGWGAVASEALMCGTPVVCSDTCGSAGVVAGSKVGGVFKVNNRNGLRALLKTAIDAQPITCKQRNAIIAWSASISAKVGAEYLLKILHYHNTQQHNKPTPPWSNQQ